MNRKVVVINGSVRVAMGEEEMKGESAVFNISTGEVVMGDAWAKLTGEGVKGYRVWKRARRKRLPSALPRCYHHLRS